MTHLPNRSSLTVLLMAIRPKTLPASAVPVFMGLVLSLYVNSLDAVLAAVTLICALLIQILTNLINDYADFKKGTDDEKRIGPIRVTQAGLVSETQMKRWIFINLGLILLSAAYLIYSGGLPILLIGILSLISAYYYTGGRSPYGYLGFGDLFVLFFFGPVAVGGTFYLQCGHIDWQILVAGFGPGLISVGILAVNNIRDMENDARTGKRTLVVRFGRNFGLWEYGLSCGIAIMIPSVLALFNDAFVYMPLLLVILPMLIVQLNILKKEREGELLNGVLGNTGRMLLIYGLLFSLAFMLKIYY